MGRAWPAYQFKVTSVISLSSSHSCPASRGDCNLPHEASCQQASYFCHTTSRLLTTETMSALPHRIGQEDLRLATDRLTTAVAKFEADLVPDGSDTDKAQRSAIVSAAHDVLALVKSPADQWMDVTAQTALMAANRLFWEWGVFDAIPLDGTPMSYNDLSVKIDVQAKLLSMTDRFPVHCKTVNVRPTAHSLTVASFSSHRWRHRLHGRAEPG